MENKMECQRRGEKPMQRKRRSGREGESACSSSREGKVVCVFACEILLFLLQELSLAELAMIGFLVSGSIHPFWEALDACDCASRTHGVL
ncbi:hypothetical protein QJS10_CPB11g00883 [Acorus calamus]|uniref:Uncharacterized protein n=1 Tax=Acorus calamus TaxID=4465 RepID=A0AAV9DTD9_ACOCL|nr:hypothetical protein QJS10_CPB11g00883 [Acorus calamus]